jgi:hypothetical protein
MVRLPASKARRIVQTDLPQRSNAATSKAARSDVVTINLVPDILARKPFGNNVQLPGIPIAGVLPIENRPSAPVVAVCPPFSSCTTTPDIGVVPVSVTVPLTAARQSDTPITIGSNALIRIMIASNQ